MSQNTKSHTQTDTDHNNAAYAVVHWWAGLYPDPAHHMRGDAGARASIRRAASLFEVMLQPACHVMFAKVRDKAGRDYLSGGTQLQRLALAGAVLCELRTTQQSGTAFTRALGANSKDEPAPLSPLRFQNLMAAMNRDGEDDALTALRRAITMLKDNPVNVRGMVRDILFYNDETRIRWTYAYYNTPRDVDPALLSTPATSTLSATEEPVQ
jgi:CRISPR type I-E-associated protein CasB/Cse2